MPRTSTSKPAPPKDESSIRYHVKINGIAPLLQHRYNGNAPAGRGRQIPKPEAEAENALYRNGVGQTYEPSSHIEGALVKASTVRRVEGRGKKSYKDFFRAGVIVEPMEIPLEASWVVDVQGVIVQRSRVMRARPRFDSWTLEFDIVNNDPSNIGDDLVKDVLAEAGRYVGIGDYRPKYGRFEVVSFERV